MRGFRFNIPLQSGTDKTLDALDALIHAAYLLNCLLPTP